MRVNTLIVPMAALLLAAAGLAHAETGALPVSDDSETLFQGETTDGASDSSTGVSEQDTAVPSDSSDGVSGDTTDTDPVDASALPTVVPEGDSSGESEEMVALPAGQFVPVDGDAVVGATGFADADEERVALSDGVPGGQSGGGDGACVLLAKDGRKLPCP